MLTLARFLELLPQFAVVDAAKITPKLPLVFAINNGFAGIEDDTIREYALALATADYILKNETNTSTLLNASSLTGNAASTGNPAGIKREKTTQRVGVKCENRDRGICRGSVIGGMSYVGVLSSAVCHM